MNYKFLTPYDDNQDHKINIQMIYTLVKYLLLQLLLVYHQANIVDEMSHTLDDQNDLLFLPINYILNNNYISEYIKNISEIGVSIRPTTLKKLFKTIHAVLVLEN